MTTDNESNKAEVLTSFKPSVAEASGAPRGDSPLIEFRGKGAGYMVTRGKSKAGREWTRVEFRFMDLEVIQASEVYVNPTASLSMFYSDPTNTPRRKADDGTDEWGWWSESTRAIYGDKINAEDIIDDMFGGIVGAGEGKMPENEGKVMHWCRIPGMFRAGPRNGQYDNPWDPSMPEDWQTKWHNEVVLGWKVLEVEGVGKLADTGAVSTDGASTGASNGATGGATAVPGNDLMTYVLGLADGKLAKDFYEVALDDPQVMKNPGLVAELNSRAFVQTMKDMQKLTQDDAGVLHKVG